MIKAQRKAEIPFAMIPLLFGIQQITEGMIWLTFRFDAPLLKMTMTFAYSLFSHVLWPIIMPFLAVVRIVAKRLARMRQIPICEDEVPSLVVRSGVARGLTQNELVGK